MSDMLGRGGPLAKFVSLTLTILLTATATALIMMRSPALAIAAAIVGGYSLGIYLDVYRDEIVAALRRRAGEEESSQG